MVGVILGDAVEVVVEAIEPVDVVAELEEVDDSGLDGGVMVTVGNWNGHEKFKCLVLVLKYSLTYSNQSCGGPDQLRVLIWGHLM